MAIGFMYMPIFRYRSEEKKVLLSRAFGKHVYPCIEIIKATEQKPRVSKKINTKVQKNKPKKKEFEDVYLPVLSRVNAEKIFVDLPVHLKEPRNMKPEVLTFMRDIVDKRDKRTEYILKLAPLADRIIPVISTYFNKTNEKNSIKLQESDLRKVFKTIAFRTFPDSFDRDFPQIEQVIKATDYFIFDIDDNLIDITDPDVFQPRLDDLRKRIKCEIIIVRNIVSTSIKNNQIEHGKLLTQIRNDLISNYKSLYGTAFGDYAGIKKDPVADGGAISPGFIFYDPIKTKYYGFRGDVHIVNGKKTGILDDFETIIVPSVIKSVSVTRMKASGLPYLNDRNLGWQIIKLIQSGDEPGRHQGKFKRISMEHYIHCIETDIMAGNIT
jgi:hypothetical protein